MISWYYHDNENKLNSFSKSDFNWDFDIVIDLFTEYHDIVMLSWYFKLSTPFTLSQIRANVVDFDIAIDNSMISWCYMLNIISSYERWSIMVSSKNLNLQESYERNIDI